MAVAATGVVIYDPLNGNNDNAGYFDASLASAGTDYPRTQAAAILTATDLACTTGGTTLTSATGGFTAAMIGNGIYIKSGTNFTVGLYVITARTDTNTVTLDRDPTNGSNASSGTGSVGGRRAVLLDAYLETPYNLAGMTHEVWATGTMTLTEALSIELDGTADGAGFINIEGRASDGSADPQGANRPTIACGAYGFDVDNYWQFTDLIFTTTGTGVRGDTACLFRNCKITNTSGTANRAAAVAGGAMWRMIDCELVSTNGYGVQDLAGTTMLTRCYIHDSKIAVLALTMVLDSNIMDACTTTGIDTNGLGAYICNNTINDCVDGIDGATLYGFIVLNNIISNCTSNGAKWSGERPVNYWDYNDFYNNGTDRTNVAAGPNDNDVDPGYTDAAGGNFSTGANVADTGFGIRLGVS
jgi:hypothetical protein